MKKKVLLTAVLILMAFQVGANEAVQVSKKYYDYIKTAQFAKLYDLVDQNAILEEAENIPEYGGNWKGIDKWKEFGAIFNGFWKDVKVEVVSIDPINDRAFIVANFEATNRKTGKRVSMPLYEIIEAQNGKITRLAAIYFDTAAIVKANQK